MSGAEREAAAVLRECRREFAARGTTAIGEAMAGGPKPSADVPAEPEPWRRYPDGEAYDPISHAQYFFHCHPVAAPPFPKAQAGATARTEFGHFHLFLRAEGMPRGVAPLFFPEQVLANAPTPPQAAPTRRGAGDRVAHLIAIALDPCGEPMRLFTTNRWVTGETWYRADDVARMLDRFAPAGDGSALLDRWLVALLRLYRTEIERLLQRRDEAVAKWRWLWPRRGNVLEDPRLEIVSQCEIDLDAALAEFDRPSGSRKLVAPPSRLPRSPKMLEGWGA